MRLFSDSRWSTIGLSCKGLCGCLVFGMEDFVAFLRRQSYTSEHFIAGWDNLGFEERHYVVVAAIGSQPAESVSIELQTDCR
eukprot:4390860-Lingulodinium_polyedra.AAC.1